MPVASPGPEVVRPAGAGPLDPQPAVTSMSNPTSVAIDERTRFRVDRDLTTPTGDPGTGLARRRRRREPRRGELLSDGVPRLARIGRREKVPLAGSAVARTDLRLGGPRPSVETHERA